MTMGQSPARRVAIAGMIGALYVVLSLVVAPFAFGPIQFRIGEALKPLVIKYPTVIPAFGVGTVIINLFSPFAGPLELVFMPLVDVSGGVICYVVARGMGTTLGTYVASLVYALWTAAGVGVVLAVSAGLPYLPSFASVAVSEIILLLLGNALLVRRV
jgi:uncharacterized membrane protein